MFNWFKQKKKKKVAHEYTKNVLSAKELATKQGEPFVTILSLDVDPNNLHEGSFELDWNDVFLARLVRAGYQAKPNDTDADIVERWFSSICRHVVLETFEQYEANLPEHNRVIKQRNLGEGFSEVS